MRKSILTALAVSAALMATGAAQAASLSWQETSTQVSTNTFNPAPDLGLVGPSIGDTVSLGTLLYSANVGGVVTFTYLGQESGYNDATGRASFASVLLDESDAIGAQASFNVAGGTNAVVDFKFYDSVGGSAINGGAWSPNSSIGLMGSNVTVTGYGTFAYVLGYNDSALGRDDWDDFVIGVNITDVEVPEPTSLALLGLGLVGLGLSRRRK